MARPALAATRAIAVLDFLAAHPAEPFTLSDLATRLGINVASAHAVLGVLTDAGYVARHPRLRTYTLGPSVVALGSAALEHHAAIDLARDAARTLSEEVELEVAVTALAGDDIVFLARAGEQRARGIPMHVGQRVPLVPPLGSVFVAWAPEDVVAAWRKRAPKAKGVDAALAGTRARGYSVALEVNARRTLADTLDHLADAPGDPQLLGSVDDLVAELGASEYQVSSLERGRRYDVSMIAAPVFDAGGAVALALTLVGFEPALPAEEIAAYGERLRDVGIVVTKRSHGRMPGVTVTA
jgi:DNA-binding IclR family transcriptional regulator